METTGLVVTAIWVYSFYSSNHAPLSKIPKILSPEAAIKYSDIAVDAGGNTTNTAKVPDCQYLVWK